MAYTYNSRNTNFKTSTNVTLNHSHNVNRYSSNNNNYNAKNDTIYYEEMHYDNWDKDHEYGYKVQVPRKVQEELNLEKVETLYGPNSKLCCPTGLIKDSDGLYIIHDNQNNRLICSYDLNADIKDWKVIDTEIKKGHTIATNNRGIYLVDDTENNNINVYKKTNGTIEKIQVFEGIGKRPHYTTYDERTNSFYCWSSESNEMFIYKVDSNGKVYLAKKQTLTNIDNDYASTKDGTGRNYIKNEAHEYTRSYYIEGDYIYFPTDYGVIKKANRDTLKVEEEMIVPGPIGGMAQISKIDGWYYLTVSTVNVRGTNNEFIGNLRNDPSKDGYAPQYGFPTMVRAKSIEDFSKGNYEEVFSEFYGNGKAVNEFQGVPYNVFTIDGVNYLTVHDAPNGVSMYSFETNNGEITNVKEVH